MSRTVLTSYLKNTRFQGSWLLGVPAPWTGRFRVKPFGMVVSRTRTEYYIVCRYSVMC